MSKGPYIEIAEADRLRSISWVGEEEERSLG